MGVQEIKKSFKNNITTLLLTSAALLNGSFNPVDDSLSNDDMDTPARDAPTLTYGPKSLDEIAAEKRAEHVRDSIYFNDLVNDDLKNNYKMRRSSNSWYFAAMVADDEGNVLWQKRADQKRVPASLTKLMTLYLVLDEIEKCNLAWDDDVKISSKADLHWRKRSNRLMENYRPKTGDIVLLEDLVEMMMSVSDNNASMAISEVIGGAKSNFAKMMNEAAKELKMEQTKFVEPTGLEWNISSPEDVYILTQALLEKFPQHKDKMCIPDYTPKEGVNPIENRGIDYIDNNTDVIKTGYLRRCRYNIVVSKTYDFNTTDQKNYSLIVFGDERGRPATEALLENLEDLKNKKYAELALKDEISNRSMEPVVNFSPQKINPVLLDSSLVKPYKPKQPKKKKLFGFF